MARKPARKSRPASRPEPAATPGPSAPAGDRDKIVAALLELLAEKRIEQIGLAEIARAAGVTLRNCATNSRRRSPSSPPTSKPSTAPCSPGILPTWRRSRRASGCSTC